MELIFLLVCLEIVFTPHKQIVYPYDKLGIKHILSLLNYIPYQLMIYLLSLVFFLIVLYTSYRYYYVPRSEAARYKKIFQKLGYKVYEHPYSFFTISFAKNYEIGKRLYKDAMYFERVVYSQVDVSIGYCLDKVLIHLINPDLIKQFFSPHLLYTYPKYDMLVAGTRAALGDGLAFSEGDQWKNKRKVLSRAFSFDLIKENIPKISEICDRCFDMIDQKSKVEQNKVRYNVLNVSARIFNGVIMKCFFGTDQIKEEVMGMQFEDFVVKTISQAAQLTLSPLLVFFGKIAWNVGFTEKIRRVKESIRLMRIKAGEVLKSRMEQVQKSDKNQKITDIIQALVYEKIANKQEYQYSDKDLIDQFQTFMIAGTDTTTRFFTMIVYFLGKYPEIHKKVREHINSIIKTDQDITYQNLKKLTYVDWLQYETTRFYGPANGNLTRIATENNQVKDVPVSKGTLMTIQPRGNHFNPKYFKDPNQFRPERWERECDSIHPYAFMGFSAGPRNCIGKQLAHIESKIALVKLIRRYKEIEVPDEIVMNVSFLYEADPFDTVFTK